MSMELTEGKVQRIFRLISAGLVGGVIQMRVENALPGVEGQPLFALETEQAP